MKNDKLQACRFVEHTEQKRATRVSANGWSDKGQ